MFYISVISEGKVVQVYNIHGESRSNKENDASKHRNVCMYLKSGASPLGAPLAPLHAATQLAREYYTRSKCFSERQNEERNACVCV